MAESDHRIPRTDIYHHRHKLECCINRLERDQAIAIRYESTIHIVPTNEWLLPD